MLRFPRAPADLQPVIVRICHRQSLPTCSTWAGKRRSPLPSADSHAYSRSFAHQPNHRQLSPEASRPSTCGLQHPALHFCPQGLRGKDVPSYSGCSLTSLDQPPRTQPGLSQKTPAPGPVRLSSYAPHPDGYTPRQRLFCNRCWCRSQTPRRAPDPPEPAARVKGDQTQSTHAQPDGPLTGFPLLEQPPVLAVANLTQTQRFLDSTPQALNIAHTVQGIGVGHCVARVSMNTDAALITGSIACPNSPRRRWLKPGRPRRYAERLASSCTRLGLSVCVKRPVTSCYVAQLQRTTALLDKNLGAVFSQPGRAGLPFQAFILT